MDFSQCLRIFHHCLLHSFISFGAGPSQFLSFSHPFLFQSRNLCFFTASCLMTNPFFTASCFNHTFFVAPITFLWWSTHFYCFLLNHTFLCFQSRNLAHKFLLLPVSSTHFCCPNPTFVVVNTHFCCQSRNLAHKFFTASCFYLKFCVVNHTTFAFHFLSPNSKFVIVKKTAA